MVTMTLTVVWGPGTWDGPKAKNHRPDPKQGYAESRHLTDIVLKSYMNRS